MTDDLPFKVVRSNGHDEVLARAMNLLFTRVAYREASSSGARNVAQMWPTRHRNQFSTNCVEALAE
jgi:hypothetical protein